MGCALAREQLSKRLHSGTSRAKEAKPLAQNPMETRQQVSTSSNHPRREAVVIDAHVEYDWRLFSRWFVGNADCLCSSTSTSGPSEEVDQVPLRVPPQGMDGSVSTEYLFNVRFPLR